MSAVLHEYTPLRPLLRTNEHLDCPVEYIKSEDDVYGTLTFLDIFKSPGPDDIPNSVLKSYAPLLTRPITYVFNASIPCAYVPSLWKRADVIPIPKVNNVGNLKKDVRHCDRYLSLNRCPSAVNVSFLNGLFHP